MFELLKDVFKFVFKFVLYLWVIVVLLSLTACFLGLLLSSVPVAK